MYRPNFSDLYPQGLWDHNQRLTCGLIYDIIRLVQSLSNFMGQFLGLLQSLLIGTKLRPCSQKSDEPVDDYYNQLQVVFKENSGFPPDDGSTHTALQFINRVTETFLLWLIGPG